MNWLDRLGSRLLHLAWLKLGWTPVSKVRVIKRGKRSKVIWLK